MTNEYTNTGTWEVTEEGTELVGIWTFHAVNPLAKKLKLEVGDVTGSEEMTIPYNAAAALPTVLKTTINETLKYDYGKLVFKKISATQDSTVIKGMLTKNDEHRFNLDFGGIQLIADGKVLQQMETGSKTGVFGSSFELMYEAIPVNTKKLELQLNSFNGYERIETEIELAGKTQIGSNWIDVQEVVQQEGRSYVRIVSDGGVYFDKVMLVTAQGDVPLQTTEQVETNRRTLVFKTGEEDLKLRIGGVYYPKQYNDSINIDLSK